MPSIISRSLTALATAAVAFAAGALISSHVAGRPVAQPTLMFGMGSEADGARRALLVKEAPVRMLTSWYNGPHDLSWMTNWHNTIVARDYADGYALHLVVWSGGPWVKLTTAYGPACGQAYPLSPGFLDDMSQLAKIFSGDGPLYVSLFSEFQTYSCHPDQWSGSENYFHALQDQYLAAEAIFHRLAPNSRVSLCWGGWQTRWSIPATGAGRALFAHFARVMAVSDFQSFQAMQGDTNVTDIQNMVQTLHRWGPVMLAYYKPDHGSQAVFDADTRAILTAPYLSQVTANGLFALSFMDNTNLKASKKTFTRIRNDVDVFASSWIIPPSLR